MAKKKIQNYQEGTPAPRSLESLYLGNENDASIVSNIEPAETDDFSIVEPLSEKYEVAIMRKRQKAQQTELAVALTENLLNIPVVEPAVKEAKEHAEQTKQAVLDVEAAELNRYDGSGYYDEQTPENRAAAAKLQAQLAGMLKKEQELINSPEFRKFETIISDLDEQWKKLTASLQNKVFFVDLFDSVRPVADKLTEQLKELSKQLQGITFNEKAKPLIEELNKAQEKSRLLFSDLFKSPGKDENGNDIEPIFFQALKKMRQQANTEEATEDLSKSYTIQLDNMLLALDKLNFAIWDSKIIEAGGQVNFISMENDADKKKGRRIDLLYTINYDAVGDDLPTPVSYFDQRVYDAVATFNRANCNVITATSLHYAIGNANNGNKPSTNQIKKLKDSIIRMSKAWITVDNIQESSAYNYRHYKYEGSLLPCAIITEVVNGHETDFAIKLLDEPPLVRFANERRQITAISTKYLQSPVSKTDDNLQIEDYLLKRILREKGEECTIILQTFYERIHIADKSDKSRKKRERLPVTVSKYLEHYKKSGFISSYSIGKTKIIIKKNKDRSE